MLAALSGTAEYALSSSNDTPWGITTGPDDNLWFTKKGANAVSKITTAGSVTDYSLSTANSQPYGIVAGPDGNLWFTEFNNNKIGKITTSGTITEYTIPTSNSQPKFITVGSDGNLWFTESNTAKIGKVTTGGAFTEYSLTAGTSPIDVTLGPDNNVWYTAILSGNYIVGKITPSGGVTEYLVSFGVYAITAGADGNLWYTSGNNSYGRITTAGENTSFGFPSGYATRGITRGPDQNVWIATGNNGIARVQTSGTPGSSTVYTFPTTLGSAEDVVFGPDDALWATSYGTTSTNDRISEYAWVQRSLPIYDDPSQEMGPSANTGHLKKEIALGFQPPTSSFQRLYEVTFSALQVGYNSATVDVRPIVEAALYSDDQGSVPSSIDARLKWNNGSWGSWINFGTSGHSAGDDYLISLQVSSAVSSSGLYPWEIEVRANFSNGDTLTRNLTGKQYVYVLNSTSSNIGHGWGIAGVPKLASASGAGMVWEYGASGTRFFETLTSTTYLSPATDRGTLVKNVDFTYTYTAKDGVKWHFDSGGSLTKVTDPNGFAVTYTYSSGKVSNIVGPDGTRATFTYSMSGRLEQIAGPGSRYVTITQDASNDLTGVKLPDGSLHTFTYDANHRATNHKIGSSNTTYAYDSGNGTLTTITYDATTSVAVNARAVQGLSTATALNADEAVGVVTDALGRTTTTVYDAYGNPLQIQTADGARTTFVRDEFGQVTTLIDPLGRVTAYEYSYGSGRGDLIKITKPDSTTQEFQYDSTFHKRTVEIDTFGNRTTHTYNATTGNLETTLDPYGNRTTLVYHTSGANNGLLEYQIDLYGHRTTLLYDANKRVETIIDVYGNRTTLNYDSAGNFQTVTDILGKATTYAYDGMRRPTTVTTPLVQTTTYVYDSRGYLTEMVDEYGKLTTYVYDSQGRRETVIDTLGNRSTTVYDAAGQVTANVDIYGNRTSYTYDLVGRQESVQDYLGNRATTTYNAAGQITETIDINGKRTTYLYDSAGRQETVIDVYSKRTTTVYNADSQVSETIDVLGNRTTILYDANGRQETVIDVYGNRTTTAYDSRGRIEATSDISGNLTTTVYDAYGRVEAKIDILGNRTTSVFDTKNRVEATINPLGNRTTSVYDAFGRVEATINALSERATTVFDSHGRVEATVNALGARTTFVYDSFGRREATVDPLGNGSTYVYDSKGRVEATIDALGRRTTSVFDAHGRQHATINALNQRATVVYDSKGRVEAQINELGKYTTAVYDAFGRAEVTVDQLGNRTTAVFDGFGRQEATIDALGRRTTTVYDSKGRVEAMVDALANRTTTVYDSKGRYEATVDARNYRTTSVYDAKGRVEATIDAAGHRVTTVFDTYGRVEATINQLGNRTSYTYDVLSRRETVKDSLGNVTTTVYDAAGQTVATVNPLGERITNVYDLAGRIREQIDQLGNKTTFVYDAVGNRTVWRDALNNRTTSVYDALNRETERTDPLGEMTTFAYDAVGHLTSSTDRLGRRRDFTYDDAGRHTGEVWIASNGSTVENRITFTYDAVGNQLAAADFDGAYTMTYDALNRVTTVHDVWGKRLTFAYDAVGNRTVVEDALGGVTTTTYDSLNRPATRLFGGSGQTPLRFDLTYKADRQPSTIERFSDLAGTTKVANTTYTYDNAGRLKNLHHRNADTGANIANYTYTYDTHSRITQIERNGTVVTYTYDDTDQLTADGTNTFTYDANGNRTNGSYTTGAGNRLTSDGTWTYTYDDEGNLTKKSKGALQETWTYGYDQRNQLTSVEKRATDGGTLQLKDEFKYDAFGNRIEKKIDSDGNGTWDTTQRYALDGWKNVNQALVGNENWDVWADLDGSSSLTTRYVRGDVIDQLFARIESGGTAYWYLTDHLGSIRDVIDSSAVVKDSITYDGFGNITAETDSNYRGRYAWTGREIEAEIDLQFNRARYYDANTGRWLNQDSLGMDAGDSNLYRYAFNRPTIEVDPSGMQQQDNNPWRNVQEFENGKLQDLITSWRKAGVKEMITYDEEISRKKAPPSMDPANNTEYWEITYKVTVKKWDIHLKFQRIQKYEDEFFSNSEKSFSKMIADGTADFNKGLNLEKEAQKLFLDAQAAALVPFAADPFAGQGINAFFMKTAALFGLAFQAKNDAARFQSQGKMRIDMGKFLLGQLHSGKLEGRRLKGWQKTGDIKYVAAGTAVEQRTIVRAAPLPATLPPPYVSNVYSGLAPLQGYADIYERIPGPL